MPDATNTVKVDGVEPSILVRIIDGKDSPERVKIFTSDDGTERYLIRGSDPILVTDKDLSVLGSVPVEVFKTSLNSVENQSEVIVTPSSIVNTSTATATTPGQSGQ